RLRTLGVAQDVGDRVADLQLAGRRDDERVPLRVGLAVREYLPDLVRRRVDLQFGVHYERPDDRVDGVARDQNDNGAEGNEQLLHDFSGSGPRVLSTSSLT